MRQRDDRRKGLCVLRYCTAYGMRCVDKVSEDGMFNFNDEVNFK